MITIAIGALGVVLMLAQWRYMPEFFRRHTEAAAPLPPDEAKRPTLKAAGQHR